MQSLTKASDSSPRACAREVFEAVPPVMYFLRRAARRRQPAELSVAQLQVLGFLRRCPRESLTAAAEDLGMALPAASRIIDGLVGKGLAARQTAAGDRRRASLSLTGKGRASLDAAIVAAQGHLEAKLADLTPQQRRLVSAAMRLLRDLVRREPRSEAASLADFSSARPRRRRPRDQGRRSR